MKSLFSLLKYIKGLLVVTLWDKLGSQAVKDILLLSYLNERKYDIVKKINKFLRYINLHHGPTELLFSAMKP